MLDWQEGMKGWQGLLGEIKAGAPRARKWDLATEFEDMGEGIEKVYGSPLQWVSNR